MSGFVTYHLKHGKPVLDAHEVGEEDFAADTATIFAGHSPVILIETINRSTVAIPVENIAHIDHAPHYTG